MRIVLIIFILLIILYLLTSYIIFLLVCRKFTVYPIKTISKNMAKALVPYKGLIEKGQKWVSKKAKEDVYIKSFDNLKLHGILIEKKNAKGIFIEAHGYRSVSTRDIYPSCYHYYNMGYSLLLIDQRASGKSEGKYLTFGINESEDIVSWCNYVNDRYPNIPIVLAGVSMGASTIMMSVSKLDSNLNVKAILADSGFVSPMEQIGYCLRHYFHIYPGLFIHTINLWCILIGKYNLRSNNTIDSLNTKDIPLLLVHGEEDDFIPIRNSFDNYNKYKGNIKKIETFKDTYHGMSYLVDPKKYIATIKKFLDNL